MTEHEHLEAVCRSLAAVQPTEESRDAFLAEAEEHRAKANAGRAFAFFIRSN